PFSAENNYSYLELRDKAKGIILFHRPVPALTYIWISPNSKFVVGLSNVKLWNPYQIVVYSKSGDCLFKQDLVGTKLKGKGKASRIGSIGIGNLYRKLRLSRTVGKLRFSLKNIAGNGCPIRSHAGPAISIELNSPQPIRRVLSARGVAGFGLGEAFPGRLPRNAERLPDNLPAHGAPP